MDVSLEDAPLPPSVGKEIDAGMERSWIVEDLITSQLQDHDKRLGPKSENPQIFHGGDHPKAVLERTTRLFDTAAHAIDPLRQDKGIKSDEQIARIAAAGHDEDQDFKVIEMEVTDPSWVLLKEKYGLADEHIGITRTRARNRVVLPKENPAETPFEQMSGNERDSAERVMERMKAENRAAGKEIFSNDEVKMAGRTVLATIPDFSIEDKTAVQPFVKKGSSAPEVFVAMADLGAAGMNQPDDPRAGILADGYKEWQEVMIGMNETITRALQTPGGLERLPLSIKHHIADKIVNWFENAQPNFVSGRKNRLDLELANLPDKYQAATPALKEFAFNMFNSSLEAVNKKAERVRELGNQVMDGETKMFNDDVFKELVSLAGYQVPVAEKTREPELIAA